jgi:hypothetical protein
MPHSWVIREEAPEFARELSTPLVSFYFRLYLIGLTALKGKHH